MKYNENNKPLVCMMTNSTCYRKTTTMTVKGVLWHSTGCNAPKLYRWVQPSDNDPNRQQLIDTIGLNAVSSDWNHTEHQAGLNCWIGKLKNGEVATVQTMPWDYRPWGCASGKKGSCNNGWIQFEICEDDLTSAEYFNEVYKEACELTAYLCKLYNIDPNGTVDVNGMQVPTILCHHDSYTYQLGSNHADVTHWFPKYGKSMETARADVAALLQEDDLTQDEFVELFYKLRESLQDNDCGTWSQQAREWAVSKGLIVGGSKTIDGEPNYMWQDFLTREQFVSVMYRFSQLMR